MPKRMTSFGQAPSSMRTAAQGIPGDDCLVSPSYQPPLTSIQRPGTCSRPELSTSTAAMPDNWWQHTRLQQCLVLYLCHNTAATSRLLHPMSLQMDRSSTQPSRVGHLGAWAYGGHNVTWRRDHSVMLKMTSACGRPQTTRSLFGERSLELGAARYELSSVLVA